MPVAISCNIKFFKCKKGTIIIKNPRVCRYQIQIGFGGSRDFPSSRGSIRLSPNAKIVFYGKARFSEGIVIRLDKSAQMEFGDNFYCNKNCFFRTMSFVRFGNNVLCGWDVILNDTDGHHIIENGQRKTNTYPITIDNHVWVASHCRISKGVKVATDSVVAQGTVLVKNYNTPNCLIAGIPGRVIKNNINWEA